VRVDAPVAESRRGLNDLASDRARRASWPADCPESGDGHGLEATGRIFEILLM
jgi:hypothetical protein